MNERTRANADERSGQPPISQDRRDDKLLEVDDPLRS
jgi:hypothetical protein